MKYLKLIILKKYFGGHRLDGIYLYSECGNCGKRVMRGASKCPHCGVHFSGEKNKYVEGYATKQPSEGSLMALILVLALTTILALIETYFFTYHILLPYSNGKFNYISIILNFFVSFIILFYVSQGLIILSLALLSFLKKIWNRYNKKYIIILVTVCSALVIFGLISTSGIFTPDTVELVGSGAYLTEFHHDGTITPIFMYFASFNTSKSYDDAGILCEFYDSSGNKIGSCSSNNLENNPIELTCDNETLYNVSRIHVILASDGITIGSDYYLNGDILYEGDFSFNNDNVTK